MKNFKSAVLISSILFCISTTLFAQTDGALTFTFTQVAHSPGYSGTKNVIAVWIQTNSGGFVKTKRRNAGSNTKDHLPTWSVNAGGTASNCLSTACNVTDATTGATLTSFAARSITWDGKGVNGSANGTTVADGIYKVTIQETWNHGTSGTTTKSYTFTKGPSPDHQTPPDDADFSNMTLDWIPAATGIEEGTEQLIGVEVYPNPSNDGFVNIKYQKANTVQVVNMLGAVLVNENIEKGNGTKVLDLTNFANGIYFIVVLENGKSSRQKIVLNK